MKLDLTKTTYVGAVRKTVKETFNFVPDGGQEELLVNLYPQIKYQTIDGIGGAITESAAYVYSLLSPEQKHRLLWHYFKPGQMGYTIVRIPIDSCDFSLSHYEADGEDDPGFQQFSFERVEKYILPMLRDAETAFGGKLKIMLSPWSPPAYMKTNGERDHGGALKKEYWLRWAEYICRYIKEYRIRGYLVTMLTLQNEPKAVQPWDSCIYTAEEEKVFLRDYIWPALVAHGLDDIEICIWDHNKERALEWAETVIDEETDHMISGLAFHWYSGDHFEALQMIRERFPAKKLLLSEACIEFSKYRQESNLANAQKYAHDIIGDLNSGMSAFLDWNLILNEQGGPNHAGNFCDAPFLYNRATKTLLSKELETYIWHISNFVRTGSVRIGLSRYTDTLEAAAFINDRIISVIFLNRTVKTVPLYLRLNNACVPFTLPANSIASGNITLF